MRTEEFDYPLPQGAIAQEPAEPRDSSRLMILDRSGGEIQEALFRDLPRFLKSGDLLVLNDTRVIPARLMGRKPTGGKCEVFLLKDLGGGRWEALLKPSRRLKPGAVIVVGDVPLKVLERTQEGTKIVEFPSEEEAKRTIDSHGQVPLPPYIKKPLGDPERYQSVFSRRPGSTAASTAALHFTPELLEELKKAGIKVAWFTLHMGLASFRPIRSEQVEEHRVPAEFYNLPEDTARQVNATKREGGRVIACGTGAVRVLEFCADQHGGVRPGSGWVDLFIVPGYRFRVIDGMITNFHMPRSSHLVLVCAFAGRERILKAYQEALRRGFRFLSFGDAMLIL